MDSYDDANDKNKNEVDVDVDVEVESQDEVLKNSHLASSEWRAAIDYSR